MLQDLDAALAIAQEAGFDVRKAEWLSYQARRRAELSDEELEGVAGASLNAQATTWCGIQRRQLEEDLLYKVWDGLGA